MTKRILVLSIYPAPYRLKLFEYFSEDFQADIFFEYGNGDQRDERWFAQGMYSLLDTDEGRQNYLRAYKNVKQYDLVVLYDYTTKESRKLIAKCKRNKIPYVVNCDGVILPYKKSFLKDYIKRRLLSKAAGYMASGRHAKEYFLRYGAKEEKIFLHRFSMLYKEDILTRPVDDQEKRYLREKLGLPIDKKIAIAVGRFIPLKRYDHLLQAWGQADENCCLLLIGGGEEQAKYQAIVEEKQLNNVIIEPFHPSEELYEYYKAADIFIHPSSYEAWGLVINEAMAKGLPVVVSDTCTGGRELVDEGKNGCLFPMGQEHIGVEKMLQILQNAELKDAMAKQSLLTIKDYTLENMAKTHVEIIKKVIKNER